MKKLPIKNLKKNSSYVFVYFQSIDFNEKNILKQCLIAILLTAFLTSFTFVGIMEDAFISLRYAYFFSNGQGLVFNPYEYVEGYSNPLWVLLLSFFIRLGAHPLLAVKWLTFFTMAGCFLSADHLHRVVLGKSLQSRILFLLLIFTFVPFGVWGTFGLESALFSLLLSEAVAYSHSDKPNGLLIILILLSLARPEGMFMGLAILTWKMTFIKKKEAGNTLIFFCIWLALYTLWRYWYFGDYIPNSLRAKARPLLTSITFGWSYIYIFLFKHNGFFPFAFCLISFWKAGWRLLLVPYLITGYTVFIVLAGGDYLSFDRFFCHIAILLMFAPLLVVKNIKNRPLKIFICILLLFSNLTYYIYPEKIFNSGFFWLNKINISLIEPSIHKERLARFLFNTDITKTNANAVIGIELEKRLQPNSLVAIAQCGVIPYASPNLRYLDTFGLMSRKIALDSNKSGSFGKATDIDIVLERKPEIISAADWEGTPLYKNLLSNENFKRSYSPWLIFRVTFDSSPLGKVIKWEEKMFRRNKKGFTYTDSKNIFLDTPVISHRIKTYY